MNLKYRSGSALNSLVRRMKNGANIPVDFGEASTRDQIHQGLASSADPKSGYGQGVNAITPKFDEFYADFRSKNPDLFDSSKQQYVLNGEKVYYPNTTEGFDKFRSDRDTSEGGKGGYGDHGQDIYKGMEQAFDQYIEGFGGNIENMSEDQIKRLREEYLESVRRASESANSNRFGA